MTTLDAIAKPAALPAAPSREPLPADPPRPVTGRPRRGPVATWLGLFFGIVAGAIGIALTLALLVILSATAVQAQTRSGAASTATAGDGAGLVLQTTAGPVVAPLVSTDATLRVTGPTVRAVIVQRFVNPQPVWIEGRYQFPLPDDAAVDHLRMQVGDRRVEGEIREKEAARREFRAAREQGRRAALVEQQRPNVFTSRVTNIAPGATIEVTIEYQQALAPKDGRWQLRLPGVVAPRYSRPSDEAAMPAAAPAYSLEAPALEGPADALRTEERLLERQGRGRAAGFMRIGWDPSWRPATMHQGIVLARASLDDVADDADAADAVGQPVLDPQEAPRNPLRIRVELDAGLPIVEPRSPSHQISVTRGPGAAGTAYRVETMDGDIADRDFVLDWSSARTAAAQATLRHERHGDAIYGLVIVTPPAAEPRPANPQPRETTFVVDTSGSMGGESIAQARRALQFGLQRLAAGDRFNIIQFNSTHSSLFAAPVPAGAATLARARRYVDALEANGGTEMAGALEQALGAPLAAGALGQVVFITDGAVDYEDALLRRVGERIGARRLYTVAIGSAPNGFLLRKLAEIGGGTFESIGRISEVERRMAALFDRLARPVHTDLALELDGGRLAEPVTMPRDLHAGEPLVLTARFSALPRAMTVSAIGADGRRWRIPVDITEAPASGLHVRWARQRIETLADDLRRAGSGRAPEAIRADIVRVALDHHLVSQYTSLIAVDRTPVRPADAPLAAGDVPANLPAGWQHETTFGNGGALAATATPAPLRLLLGVLLLAAGFLLLVSRRGARFVATGAAR